MPFLKIDWREEFLLLSQDMPAQIFLTIQKGRHPLSGYRPVKNCVVPNYLSDELLYGIGCFFDCERRGDYTVDFFVVLDESFKFVQEYVKACSVVLADLESGVNEEIGNVVVACKNTCDETVQGLTVGYKVFIGVDQAALIVDFEVELVALFDADYRTVGRAERGVYEVDESLGLAGTFLAYN
jgi:hypothetical protein